MIVDPHLSELIVWGHIVIVGKETSSMGCEAVSTTMIVGISVHAKKEKKLMKKEAHTLPMTFSVGKGLTRPKYLEMCSTTLALLLYSNEIEMGRPLTLKIHQKSLSMV